MAKRSTKKKEVRHEPASQAAPPSRIVSRFSRDWLLGLILILAVVLAYQPVWHAGFIWDDNAIATSNPVVVGPLGLKEIWTTSAADICPLTITTFRLEYALWGLAPLPYHLVNVFMHGVSAVVLWRVLRSLQAPGAWLGAALWALHPVQVESVAWVAEMKNTESGLFFLLSILFLVRWLKAKDSNERSGGGWNYGPALFFAALAMAAKSSTVILPLILCWCIWWVEGRWRWRNLVRLAPIFLMSLAAGAVSIWTQSLERADDPHWIRAWPERLATAGDVVWFYLGKLLWPHPLITIYPRWQIDAGRAATYLPLLAVLIILLGLWLKRDSWGRPYFMAFACFLTALIPVLGLVQISFFCYSLVADHFQYLASMAPLALAGAGLARLADVMIPKRPLLQAVLCAGLLLIPGAGSWQQARIYQNEETLWSYMVAGNPASSLGRNNLGIALAHRKRVAEAIDEFQKALEINPAYADAHYNLGDAFWEKGRLDEAIVQYQITVEIAPGNAKAWNNLGGGLLEKGRVDEAMALFKRALKIDPNYAPAHNNLGIAFAQKGQLDEAIAQFHEVMQLSPHFTDVEENLAKAERMAQQARGPK